MAAGGLASGQTPTECAHLECQQEASLTSELLSNVKSAGTIRLHNIHLLHNNAGCMSVN